MDGVIQGGYLRIEDNRKKHVKLLTEKTTLYAFVFSATQYKQELKTVVAAVVICYILVAQGTHSQIWSMVL